MTCGTYISLTPEQQQATIRAYAQRHDRPLLSSNENAYRLVAVFCTLDPNQLIRDSLLLK